MRRRHGLAALALAAGLVLPACGTSSKDEAPSGPAPATVTAIPGSEVKLVTLTKRAHERLGIETAAAESRKHATTVPFSAVIYDNEGATWVYTPQDGRPLSFVRHRVTVGDVRGDRARLSKGAPAAGAPVVSTGAQMLWGTELGVGTD